MKRYSLMILVLLLAVSVSMTASSIAKETGKVTVIATDMAGPPTDIVAGSPSYYGAINDHAAINDHMWSIVTNGDETWINTGPLGLADYYNLIYTTRLTDELKTTVPKPVNGCENNRYAECAANLDRSPRDWVLRKTRFSLIT